MGGEELYMQQNNQNSNLLVVSRQKVEFQLRYTRGPHYVGNGTEALQGHRTYISNLRQTGKLLMGGPFPDFGPPVVSVVDEAEVLSIVHSDPAVAAAELQVQVLRWDIKFGVNIPL